MLIAVGIFVLGIACGFGGACILFYMLDRAYTMGKEDAKR